jgi:hypothetical protein
MGITMAKFQKGDTVQFRDPTHAKYWFLKENVGTVVETQQSYRSLDELMVYANFGGKRVYGSEASFELLVRAPVEQSRRSQ